MIRLWGWVAAAFAALVGVLLLVMGQRDKAKQKLKTARVQVENSRANRAAEHAAREAQSAAQEKSSEVQREADERPSDKRPVGHFRR